MAAVRLESLRYEIACALEGQSPDTIKLLSVREQRRRGIQAQSLEEKARLLFAREQEYHRRLPEYRYIKTESTVRRAVLLICEKDTETPCSRACSKPCRHQT